MLKRAPKNTTTQKVSSFSVPVIYEDGNVLAVNKPAGISVHGGPQIKEKTLVDWLIEKYPGLKKVGDLPAGRQVIQTRPGIVHRLDKDTSGVLAIAKNQKTFEFLKKQFKSRKVEKKYIALVYGALEKGQGVIELPIGKGGKDFRKKAVGRGMRGKIREAVTEYKLLEKFREYTLVEVFPKTGRMHQIRVHMKSINHPVVCDKLYAGRKRECPFGLKRHFLHASSLSFSLPDSSKIKLEADLPEDLQRILNMLN